MVSFVNAFCGAGKTHWAINLGKELISKKKRVMFVVPSLALQYEIGERLEDIPYRIINYKESCGNGVASEIAKYIKRPPAYEILIITHQSFKLITHFPNKKAWTVFIDEEIEIFDFMNFDSGEGSKYEYGNDLVNDMSKISDFSLEKENYTSITLKELTKKDIQFLKTLSYGSNASNFVYPPFKTFIGHLLNPNMDLFSDTAGMVAFKFGHTECDIWAEFNVEVFKGFADIYFMGAEIQRSKLASYLKLKGIKTQEHKIPKRFEKHEQPITIKYMTAHKLWSKKYYNSINGVAKVSNFELYDLLVSNDIGSEPILLQSNKGNPFVHIKNPVQMPYEIKGLNQFDSYSHYCESGAYNMPPVCFQKMENLGFDMVELQLNHALSHAYQGLLRGSLRHGGFSNNIVYLPTEQLAYAMRNIFFPMAEVKQIEGAEIFF